MRSGLENFEFEPPLTSLLTSLFSLLQQKNNSYTLHEANQNFLDGLPFVYQDF